MKGHTEPHGPSALPRSPGVSEPSGQPQGRVRDPEEPRQPQGRRGPRSRPGLPLEGPRPGAPSSGLAPGLGQSG